MPEREHGRAGGARKELEVAGGEERARIRGTVARASARATLGGRAARSCYGRNRAFRSRRPPAGIGVTPTDGAAATVSAGDGQPARGLSVSAGGREPGATDAAVSDRSTEADGSVDAHRGPTFVLASLLLLAGVLVGLSPVFGIVVTADSSPTTAATVAAFVAVLPGLLALVLTGYRTLGGLAATAGAGVIGVVRLLDRPGVADRRRFGQPARAVRRDLGSSAALRPGRRCLVAAGRRCAVAGGRCAGGHQAGHLQRPSASWPHGPDAIFGGPGSSISGQPAASGGAVPPTPDHPELSSDTADPVPWWARR